MTINVNTSLAIIFMLGLLILAVGYLVVEIIDGKRYRFRQSLDRYNNALFDRILHYIIWGILTNIGILLFEVFFRGGELTLIDLFNNSGNISSSIIGNNIDKVGIQIFVFTIFYFIYLIILLILFWIGNFIFSKAGTIRKKFESIKGNKQIKHKK